MTFLIGSLISLSASTWIYFGNGENFKKYEIFAVSVLIGMASTTMLITSLAITSDLIGSNTVCSLQKFNTKFQDKTDLIAFSPIIVKWCLCFWCYEFCR